MRFTSVALGLVCLVSGSAHAAPLPASVDFPGKRVNSVVFSPDGRFVACGGSSASGDPHERGILYVWDREFSQVHFWVYALSGEVYSVAFSPDGRVIATGGHHGRSASDTERSEHVRLWDAETGDRLATLVGQRDGVTCVAFSPDGRTLASGSFDGTVLLRNDFGVRIHPSQGGGVSSIAFSPNGNSLAVGRFGGLVELWSTATPTRQSEHRVHDGEHGTWPVFLSDGSAMALGTPEGSIQVVNTTDFAELDRYPLDAPGTQVVFAFSRDADMIAASDGRLDGPSNVSVWDTATTRRIATLSHDGGISSISFAPEDGAVACGSYDGTLKILPLRDDPARPTAGTDELAGSDSVFADRITFFGSRIRDQEAALVQTMKPDGTDVTTVLELHDQLIRDGRVSPDGMRAAVSVDDDVWVLESDLSHRVVAENVALVSWFGDKDTLVCRDESGHFIVDNATGVRQPLPVHQGHLLRDVAPSGNQVVAMDGENRLFELRPDDYYPLRQIYFASMDSIQDVIWHTSPELDCIDPRYSPDGRLIAYYSREYIDGNPRETAAVLEAETREPKEVVCFTELSDVWSLRPLGGPHWSANSEEMVWLVTRRRRDVVTNSFDLELVFVNVDGSELRRMMLKQGDVEFAFKLDWR